MIMEVISKLIFGGLSASIVLVALSDSFGFYRFSLRPVLHLTWMTMTIRPHYGHSLRTSMPDKEINQNFDSNKTLKIATIKTI